MYYLKASLKKYQCHLVPQLLLAAIMAILLAAGDAQISQAASLASQTTSDHCQSLGSLVESKPIKDDGGHTIGELDIYYNSATGYNCAYTQGIGQARGTSTVKGVAIYACKQTTASDSCDHTGKMQDEGDYLYYAGPVGLDGKGHCISVIGWVVWKGVSHDTYTRNASHCG